MPDFKLDCQKCTDKQKYERGCEKDSPLPGRWQIGEQMFQRCPLKTVNLSSYKMIQAYNFYKNGYLPNSGGWMDQSAKFIEAIDVIEKEVSDRKIS